MPEETLGVVIERLDNIKRQNEEDHKLLKEQNEAEHKRIEEQVKKTNGSVANLKLWQARILGALTILSAIVIPILFMFLSRWIDNIK